jgi:hypothetical protein
MPFPVCEIVAHEASGTEWRERPLCRRCFHDERVQAFGKSRIP